MGAILDPNIAQIKESKAQGFIHTESRQTMICWRPSAELNRTLRRESPDMQQADRGQKEAHSRRRRHVGLPGQRHEAKVCDAQGLS